MLVEKAGLNLVEVGERNNFTNLVDNESFKVDLSQEPNKKEEADMIEPIVDKQFTKPNYHNEAIIAEGQGYKANNQATGIPHTSLNKVEDQDMNYEKIWKVLEAITYLTKWKYLEQFDPKYQSLNTAVQTYFSSGKRYPWSRCPGCTNVVLKRGYCDLHFLNYHSIHFLAKSRSG